ncbi:MAG: amino acid permease [Deltaproteobacteria bacterium]|nr:amino acid permease [Deltaproteobacteria bacterium]
MTTAADLTLSPLSPAKLDKVLTLFDSTMIVVGSMIGSGIFIVSADISRQVQSPALLIAAWLVSGLMTLLCALSYAELSAALPEAGGQYAFLRTSLGPLWGFLYGWSMLTVIQTATIAAVAIAFAKFTGVLVPWFSSTAWIVKLGTFGPFELFGFALGPYNVGLSTQNLLAILLIILLTFVNSRGLKTGARVQNLFTVLKTAAVLGLILLAFVFGTDQAQSLNLAGFWDNAGLFAEHAYRGGAEPVMVSGLTLLAVAMVGSLFSADAWNNVTFTAAEVENPQKNLPRALALGVGLVTVVYVIANVAYLNVLPLVGAADGATPIARGIQFAAEDRVGTATAEVIFGAQGAVIMAVAIMISTFGCNNGLILAGARVYYAMAKDGLFFRAIGTVSDRHVPKAALVLQAVWASVLCLSGTYGQLLDFIIFAVLLFYILTIIGLFVLRRRRPDLPRPYKVIGYPYLPALYIVMAAFIEIQLLRYKPQYTWPGLCLVLVGIPVYYLWRRRPATAAANHQA